MKSAAAVMVGILMLSVAVGPGKTEVSVTTDASFWEKDEYCDSL